MTPKLTIDIFIERSVTKHGNYYNYDEVIYTGKGNKVKILCPKHGLFEQRAGDHMKGSGCAKCGVFKCQDWKRVTTEKFIERANKLYNSFFDYNKSVCKTAEDIVSIQCPLHGEFTQKVKEHLKGRGCKTCNKYKYYSFSRTKYINLHKFSNFYFLLMSKNDEMFVKVGITFKRLKWRYTKTHPYAVTKLLFFEQTSTFVWDLESHLKTILKQQRHIPKIKFNGWTECFNIKSVPEIFDLITDFKNNYIEEKL